MVKINGKNEECHKIAISVFLAEKNIPIEKVAIELNGKIVPKNKYNETVLMNGDEVEIVSFVGGG